MDKILELRELKEIPVCGPVFIGSTPQTPLCDAVFLAIISVDLRCRGGKCGKDSLWSDNNQLQDLGTKLACWPAPNSSAHVCNTAHEF